MCDENKEQKNIKRQNEKNSILKRNVVIVEKKMRQLFNQLFEQKKSEKEKNE